MELVGASRGCGERNAITGNVNALGIAIGKHEQHLRARNEGQQLFCQPAPRGIPRADWHNDRQASGRRISRATHLHPGQARLPPQLLPAPAVQP